MKSSWNTDNFCQQYGIYSQADQNKNLQKVWFSIALFFYNSMLSSFQMRFKAASKLHFHGSLR